MKLMIGVLLFAGFSFVFVNHAHAYIDLSVGSLLIQGLIAALVSIGIFWRRFWSFLGRLFGRNKEE